MLDSKKQRTERWAGMQAALAPCLQKPGVFQHVEGALSRDYFATRVAGKTRENVYLGPIRSMVQIGKFVVLQIDENLIFEDVGSLPPVGFEWVTVDGVIVTVDGVKVYA